MLRRRSAILWVLTVHLLVHAAVAMAPPACDCTTHGESTEVAATVAADACCAGCHDATGPTGAPTESPTSAPSDDAPCCPQDGSCPKPCCNGFMGAPAMLPTAGVSALAPRPRVTMHAPPADAPSSANRERLRRPPRSREIV